MTADGHPECPVCDHSGHTCPGCGASVPHPGDAEPVVQGIGNEQGDTTRTNPRGTSVLELIGLPTQQSQKRSTR